MADITISGRVVFDNDAPIRDARIRIWETDSGQNADDLIVDVRTNPQGRFSGSGDWRDARFGIEIATYRYQVDWNGQRKTGRNILNPHNFFSTVETNFADPNAAPTPPAPGPGTIALSGTVIFDGGGAIEGARVRIWETDSGNNADDLIVDAVTPANGTFSGSGFWRDGGLGIEVPTWRWRVDWNGQVETGTNVANAQQAFRVMRMPWSSDVTWTNWLSDLATDIPNANFARPTSRRQLRDAIQDAVARNLKVKVVGSGHSHSMVAQPVEDNMLINMHGLRGQMRPYPWQRGGANKLEPVQGIGPGFVRVRAGTRLREINRDILAPSGQGLVNMGPFDGQTISGAIATNTHGTGLGTGGFADMVASMEMFVIVPRANGDHDVEIWVIEPADGISDPVRFMETNRDPSRRLKQNDDLFRAAVCSYGLFGVALSFVLTVRPLYWLDEVNVRSTWRTLKTQIDNGQILGSDSAVSAQTKMYVHVARAIRQGGMTDNTPCRRDDWNEQPVENQPSNWTEIWPPERSGGGGGGLADVISGSTFDITGRPSSVNATLLGAAFFQSKNRNFFAGSRNSSAYYRAIRRKVDDTLEIDPAIASDLTDNTISSNAAAPPSSSDRALTVELAVPVADTAAAVEAAVDSMVNQDINFLIPIGIRFTRASDLHLCPTAGRDTAFIEVSGWLPNARRGAWERYRRTYRTALEQIVADVRVAVPSTRVHLGKHNADSASRFAQDYPGFANWIDMYGLFNRTGIFDCPNSERWALSSATPFRTHAQARQEMLDL